MLHYVGMGLFTTWKTLRAMVAGADGIASPWADPAALATIDTSALSAIGGDFSRESAMSIAAILRARNLICTTAARALLVAYRDGEKLADQPAWITRTDSILTPYHRMLWTIDDLLFYGYSLWRVDRDVNGKMLAADRVPYDTWKFTPTGDVMVGAEIATDSRYVLIPGIHQGILYHGGEVIPQALALARGVTRAVETPSATVELHYTGDKPMTDEEKRAVVTSWVAARKGKNGGVALTNKYTEVKEHGAAAEHLLVEGRNANAIDVARLCSIPASMIDATVNGSSITYSNSGSRMAELMTFGVAPMIACVTARMGMDDVSPRGTHIEVDSTDMIEYLNRVAVQDDFAQPKLPKES